MCLVPQLTDAGSLRHPVPSRWIDSHIGGFSFVSIAPLFLSSVYSKAEGDTWVQRKLHHGSIIRVIEVSLGPQSPIRSHHSGLPSLSSNNLAFDDPAHKKVVAPEDLASTLAGLHICLAAFDRTTHLVITDEVGSTRCWTCSSLSSPLRYDDSDVHSFIVFFAIISNLYTQKPFQSVVDGFATGAIPTKHNVTKVIGITADVGEVHRLCQYQIAAAAKHDVTSSME
ncbi:hypothetical protein FRC03_003272 [Tulasnella sp. 419]|nr:hypothetical protein FRC03_003272 [Tulasnella sp. 419]